MSEGPSLINPDSFTPLSGQLEYGSRVQLVHTTSGTSLPPMRLHKVCLCLEEAVQVEKNKVSLDSDDALFQLHKCVFQMQKEAEDEEALYLGVEDERITQYQVSCTLLAYVSGPTSRRQIR